MKGKRLESIIVFSICLNGCGTSKSFSIPEEFKDYVFVNGLNMYRCNGGTIEGMLPGFSKDERTFDVKKNTLNVGEKVYFISRGLLEPGDKYKRNGCFSYEYNTGEIERIPFSGSLKESMSFDLSYGEENTIQKEKNGLPVIYTPNSQIASSSESRYPLAALRNKYFYCERDREYPLIWIYDNKLGDGIPFSYFKDRDGLSLSHYLNGFNDVSAIYSPEDNEHICIFKRDGFWCDEIYKISHNGFVNEFERIQGRFCVSNSMTKLSNFSEYSLHERYDSCATRYYIQDYGDSYRVKDMAGYDKPLDLSKFGKYSRVSGSLNYLMSLNLLFMELENENNPKDKLDIIYDLNTGETKKTSIGHIHKANKDASSNDDFFVYEDEKYSFISRFTYDGKVSLIAVSKEDGKETILQQKERDRRPKSLRMKNEYTFSYEMIYDYVYKTSSDEMKD